MKSKRTSKPKRSWREKLVDSKDLPKVGPIDDRMTKRWGEGTMVIPAPLEVDALIKRVRRGKLTTVDGLRQALAATHGVTIACPLTTGIFAWITAHDAADEAEQGGRKRITPNWRTLKTDGELNPKYPGGIANQKACLEAEGHTMVAKEKRFYVVEYERKLVRL